MLLTHTTDVRRLRSILATGLLCAKSEGKRKAIWLHSAGFSDWAIRHVCGRHKIGLKRICQIEIDVPRSWLRKSKRGLWYCCQDIPPERFRGVGRFVQMPFQEV